MTRELTLKPESDENGEAVLDRKVIEMNFAKGSSVEVADKHNSKETYTVSIDKISIFDQFLVINGIRYSIIKMVSK